MSSCDVLSEGNVHSEKRERPDMRTVESMTSCGLESDNYVMLGEYHVVVFLGSSLLANDEFRLVITLFAPLASRTARSRSSRRRDHCS